MAEKILVADDEPAILKLLQSRLKAHGYEVVTASDGQEALRKARSEQPDLIILDVMLPRLDGYRVCRLLKFDDNYKHIPILLLTVLGDEKDKQKGLQAGADAYLLKPFDSEMLLNQVKQLLKNE